MRPDPRSTLGALGRAGLACALLGALACGPSSPRGTNPPAPPSAADVARTLPGPDFELLGLDRERHRLSDFHGRVVLVNFWATWCLSCRTELPALDRLHASFADQGVAIVGIATDQEGRSVVAPYVEELGLRFPILLDPNAVSARIFGGLTGYPTTFVLDAQGLIYSSYLGAQDEATFAEDLRYLLQAEPSEAAALPEGARSRAPLSPDDTEPD